MAASVSDQPRFRGQALPARVASGLLLAVVAAAAVWAGGLPFVLLLGAMLLVALWEYLRLCGRAALAVFRWPAMVAGGGLVAWAAGYEPSVVSAVTAAAALWMIGAALRAPIEGRLVGLALTLFGVLYVAGLGVHLIRLRMLEVGWTPLMLVLLGTWAADTFAFFVGVRWGRRRLAPHISPHKSVEGFLGGVSGSVLVTAGAARWLAPDLGLGVAALLGLVVGVAAPLGDLLESMIKRNLGAKDASHVIPGHGGVLDRIDSLLLSGPAAYILFRLLGC